MTASDQQMLTEMQEWLITEALGIVMAIIVLLLGRLLKKLVIYMVNKFCEKSKRINPSAHGFIIACTNVLCNIMIVITAVGCVINITAILAALGAAGLTASFALQGSLSNFISGAQLVFSRPFEVGDFVQIGDEMGTCTKIRVLNTELITLDNKKVVIPNSIVTNTTVLNLSSESLRRIDLTYSVSYSTDLDKAFAVLREAAGGCELILKEPETFVGVEKHSDSSIDLILKAWINSTDYWDVYYYLQKNVKEAFDRNGIEIPFPQIDVHQR